MNELLDKLYQEAEDYAENASVPDRYICDIETAFREGAKWGFRQVQQRQLDVRGIQG